MQREYQDQLCIPIALENADEACVQTHTAKSMRLGSAQNVLLVTLDLWSSRVSKAASDTGDGSAVKTSSGSEAPPKDRHISALYWEPDRPLLGEDQWKFIESLIEELEDEDDARNMRETEAAGKKDGGQRPSSSSSSSSISGLGGVDDDGLPVATPTPIGVVDTVFICSDVPTGLASRSPSDGKKPFTKLGKR